MQQETGALGTAPGGAASRGVRWPAYILLIYGAVGVALHLRLPDLLGAAVATLGGHADFRQAPAELPGLAPLFAHYADHPWLPWAAWLAGLALLAWSARGVAWPSLPAAARAVIPRIRRPGWLGWLTGGVALALLALGAYARLNVLVPQARGLTQLPYDDEGVYAGASQLALQGILPYRDFFFAHPPLAALVYTPALAYHFTEWGSVTSFVLARYLSVAYSLAALLAFFAVGWQLGASGAQMGAARWRPLLMGATAAGLWAIDERAIEINRKIMLDQPMILAGLLALVAYLAFLRRAGRAAAPPGPRWLLVAAGVLAAASAFTKIQGMACIVALALDMVLRVPWRQAGTARRARLADLGALLGGFAAVTLVVIGPFLLIAPSAFIRMVGFFQLLRPSDGLVAPADRIANLTSTLENGPTVYLAALGFLALTGWVVWLYRAKGAGAEELVAAEHRGLDAWRVIVLWSFLSVLLFTYSRSFYGHYYIQLGAALCLLAPAIWLPLLWPAPDGERRVAFGLALLLLPALVLVGPAWQSFTTRSDDTVFEVVARYVNDAVPPDAPVLSTDEQFNFLASRPPSHNGTGYLIDSYGHMIFLGLGLDRRDWGDLLGAVLRGEHGDDPYRAMWQPAPQQDYLDRVKQAALVVVHDRGIPRLLETTRAALFQESKLREEAPAGCRSDVPPTRGGCRYLILAPQGAR